MSSNRETIFSVLALDVDPDDPVCNYQFIWEYGIFFKNKGLFFLSDEKPHHTLSAISLYCSLKTKRMETEQ